MMTGIISLPPKAAAQFAERAKRMDGCVRVGNAFEWAQGNNVVCLIMIDPPTGHVGKDSRRADQIRLELAKMDPANN